MLQVEGIDSGYGDMTVVHDFSMKLNDGHITCIIGPNGSGKSTILKTIVGILEPTKGKILLDGADITGLNPNEILLKGICILPQGRTVFPMMTVLENLQMGAYTVKDNRMIRTRLEEVYSLFPVLEKRKKDAADNLSGGEQAMLCIARGLMSNPKAILFDEPSLGLAPTVTDMVYKTIEQINGKGCSMIIVEQNVRKVLSVADYAYVLRGGRNEFEGSRETLQQDDRIKRLYLDMLWSRNGQNSHP